MPSDHFYDVLYRILKDVLLDRDYSDLLRKLEEDHSVCVVQAILTCSSHVWTLWLTISPMAPILA
jgi:hypothetical protein